MSYFNVDRDAIDNAAGEAVLQNRQAITQIDRLDSVLKSIPSGPDGDQLTELYGYTVDEAYRLRLVFEALKAKTDEMASIMEIAKALTGLR